MDDGLSSGPSRATELPVSRRRVTCAAAFALYVLTAARSPDPWSGAGALVGLFVVCASVGPNYVTLNIGGKLAAEIALNALVQWTLVGTVIGLICKPALAGAS